MEFQHRPRLKSLAVVFVGIVVLQLLVAAGSIAVLSSVRAYIAGESLYSKGQKDALLHLRSYIESHDEADYMRFLEAQSVPEGDAVARRALEQSVPDFEAARAGFLAGQNHPQDVSGMILLFSLTHKTSLMNASVEKWVQADDALTELRLRARQLHGRFINGLVNESERKELVKQISEVNVRLTQLERQFSERLGEASRTVQGSLLVVNGLIALLLSCVGVWYIQLTLREQQHKEAEMTDLVSAVGDGVLVVNGESQIVLLNRAAEAMFGCSSVDVKGVSVDHFIPAAARSLTPSRAPVRADVVYEFEGIHSDGHVLHLEASLSPLDSAHGSFTVVVCRDVTDRHLAHERENELRQLRHQELERKAYTDPLTRLPNREALERHLNDVLDMADGSGNGPSVLFLDVDDFKGVNDKHGHLVGDELLRQVADRLQSALRKEDRAFRVSGDEFVVVVAADAPPDIAQHAAKRVVSAMRTPFIIGETSIAVTVSVGIASYPENGSDVRALLLAADASMYRAKKSGKNGFAVNPSAVDVLPD